MGHKFSIHMKQVTGALNYYFFDGEHIVTFHYIVSVAGEEADSFWTYRGFLELKTHPHWGKMDTYTGGGYVAGLGRSWQEANDTIVELMENRYVLPVMISV